MRFIVELEGPVFDVAAACHAAHVGAARAVGWSALEQSAFWRLLRTRGDRAEFLPGANELKLKTYFEKYTEMLDSDAIASKWEAEEEIVATLNIIARHGPVFAVTLGSNLEVKKRALTGAKIERLFREVVALSPDPRRRPAELAALSEKDHRAIVVACSDTLIRAADQAQLFTVGLSRGPCGIERLQRAGPRIVFKELAELSGSLQKQGLDLVRAGLLPRPHGT